MIIFTEEHKSQTNVKMAAFLFLVPQFFPQMALLVLAHAFCEPQMVDKSNSFVYEFTNSCSTFMEEFNDFNFDSVNTTEKVKLYH